MIGENSELKEIVYFLNEVNTSDQIEEYIKNYVCEGKDSLEKNFNMAMAVDLGRIKFVVYPVQSEKIKEKILRLKTSEEIEYKNTLSERDKFETDLCFAILHSKNGRFNFIFEELIDEITARIDEYEKL